LDQSTLETQDRGNRSAVTGGKQMDGFLDLLKSSLIVNGVAENCIFTNKDLELPGFFRPSKKWDLLVIDDKQLVLSVELKSQVGPSFGNNFNNRTEEALGSAVDIWTAYREGLFPNSSPWLGYLMFVEDCKGSSSPISVHSPHFDTLPEFKNSSYINRYAILCKKLVSERHYSKACLLISKQTDSHSGDFSIPDNQLSFKSFLLSMLSSVLAHHIAKG
jgi:hypothetical protein